MTKSKLQNKMYTMDKCVFKTDVIWCDKVIITCNVIFSSYYKTYFSYFWKNKKKNRIESTPTPENSIDKNNLLPLQYVLYQ